MIRFGADLIEENRALFQGRVALITSPSGRTADNASTIDRLREVCDLRLLLAPEHGVRGDKGAGERFSGGIDALSGLPMMSMYEKGSQQLPREALPRFDTLVYDIQDVGCRYYTYISTLKNGLEACAGAGKRLVVLDRPDPLGDRAEGTLMEAGLTSFVGCYALPARYGMTCGEFAHMVNREQGLDCDLHVVRCRGLRRGMDFSCWERIWVMPSLAMPRFETALLYPGTCLIEGTNCSEGRGTAAPFELVGAPFIQAEDFAKKFNALGCPGITATPVWFTPAYSKHQDSLCGGVHFHVTHKESLRPVAMGLRLIKLLQEEYPDDFSLLPAGTDGIPFVSRLAGHREIERADWSPEDLIARGEAESAAFRARAEQYRLYQIGG